MVTYEDMSKYAQEKKEKLRKKQLNMDVAEALRDANMRAQTKIAQSQERINKAVSKKVMERLREDEKIKQTKLEQDHKINEVDFDIENLQEIKKIRQAEISRKEKQEREIKKENYSEKESKIKETNKENSAEMLQKYEELRKEEERLDQEIKQLESLNNKPIESKEVGNA